VRLDRVDGLYAVCRLPPDAAVPEWACHGALWSVTRTPAELSIVCEASSVPAGVRAEEPWRGLVVRGPLDFSLTGVMASLSAPMAAAGISIFVLSTYDTDYLLVRDHAFERAIEVLTDAGHVVSR
jgi:hypothetical protein